MIDKLYFYISGSTVPYHNIAVEAFMLERLPPRGCIFYLWQNRRTVVVGRNQNAWKECRVEELKDDGGFLARRRVGGLVFDLKRKFLFILFDFLFFA
jgi:lipoate-protein ligase A